MEKIYRVWEIELQAVLEINKIGHRKRILYSLIGQRIEPPNIEEINDDSSSTDALDILVESSDNNSNPPKPVPPAKPKTLPRQRKSRPAPQPPTNTSNLEMRAPAELLLTNQGSLQATWKHSAAALVSGSIKYEVFVSLKAFCQPDVELNQFIHSIWGQPLLKSCAAPSRLESQYRNSRKETA